MVHIGWLYVVGILSTVLGMVVMALFTVSKRNETMRIRFYFIDQNTGSTETEEMEFPEGTPDQEIEKEFNKWYVDRRSEYVGWEALQ